MDITDIAKLAGVSPSTVSKVMNHKDHGISEQTRERVLKIAREFHYVPYARSRTTNNWMLGVCFRSPISFDSTLDGILTHAQSKNYSTLVFNSYADLIQEKKNLMALRSSGVAGIIWEPVSMESLALLDEIDFGNTEIITIGPNGGDRSLLLPYEAAGHSLTSRLLNAGHHHIICLCTPGRRTPDFLHGFKRCLFEHGMSFDESLLYEEPTEELLNKIGRGEITGVVCSHYHMARSLYARLIAIHYRTPEDCSIVSLRNDGGSSWTKDTDGAISTCTIHNSQFGELICKNIICKVEGTESTSTFTSDFELDNESSLGSPAASESKRAIVVGSINIDTYLSVEELPLQDITVSTGQSLTHLGGKGANQAIGVARLGHPTTLIGCVGSDSFSDSAYQHLEDWGVDTSGVHRKLNEETGRAFIFVSPQGESLITLVPGANARLEAQDVSSQESLFDGVQCCIAQTEIPLHAIREAFRIAKKNDALTILKPAACGPIPQDIIKHTDIIVPSKNELAAIVPEKDSIDSRAAALLELGVSIVIVTLGKDGCRLYTDHTTATFPAPATKAVDTTGAGDAFVSALAACILNEDKLEIAIEKANYAAAYSVTRLGVADSFIDGQSLARAFS